MESNIGDLTGQTFGTCTLVKPLGQGGMGAVYLARQTRPSRNVAVKILHPNQMVDDQLYHEFLARFEREADVIARLEHINIMPIYEYGEQNNIPYLVMPHLMGGSLRDLLAKNGALPLTNATTIYRGGSFRTRLCTLPRSNSPRLKTCKLSFTCRWQTGSGRFWHRPYYRQQRLGGLRPYPHWYNHRNP